MSRLKGEGVQGNRRAISVMDPGSNSAAYSENKCD